MRVGILFGVLAIWLFAIAAYGMGTGHIWSLQRIGPEWVSRSEQPIVFYMWLTATSALGALATALAGFGFWSKQKSKMAERRYFVQRELLERPKE